MHVAVKVGEKGLPGGKSRSTEKTMGKSTAPTIKDSPDLKSGHETWGEERDQRNDPVPSSAGITKQKKKTVK